jgi:hypothetical protein
LLAGSRRALLQGICSPTRKGAAATLSPWLSRAFLAAAAFHPPWDWSCAFFAAEENARSSSRGRNLLLAPERRWAMALWHTPRETERRGRGEIAVV